MNMLGFFLGRPKSSVVLALLIAVCGLLCLVRIPIADYPEIAPPMVSVSTSYSGASPQVVADTVATPIEVEVNGVDNVDHFESTCTDYGNYSMSITFKAGTDPDINLVNVQNAVKRAEPKLPGEVVQVGVSVVKSPSDYMVRFGFTTDGVNMSETELGAIVGKEIKEALQRVDGVSQVDGSARAEYAMRVWLDPLKMDALGISVFDVKSAIAQQNIQPAAGFVGNAFASDHLNYKINVRGRLATAEEFGAIVVRSDPTTGSRVLLNDIARCELGSKSYDSQPRVGDRTTFFLSAFRDPRANTVTSAARCKAVVDEWMRRMPKGVECVVVLDNTLFTEEMVGGIVRSMLAAIAVALALVFLLMGGWRPLVVVAVALPVSLLGAFLYMTVAGYSLNILTAFGLTLAVGAVLGNAVAAYDTAARGERPQKGFGVALASTLAATACYVPLALHGGMVGMMYVRFAATLLVVLAVSALLSFSLLPALAVRLASRGERRRIFPDVGRLVLGALRRPYLAVVGALVRHPILSLLPLAALAVAGMLPMRWLPGAFMPEEDRGYIKIETELSEGSTIKRMNEVIDRAHALIEDIPGVEVVSSAAASSFVGKTGENHGEISVLLSPWRERAKSGRTLKAVSADIESRLAEISSARFTLIYPPAINGLGNYGGVVVYLCALGQHDPARHAADAEAYADKLAALPQVKSVVTTFSASTPQLFLSVDRDKAQALGVPASTVFSTLQNELASFYVNDFNLRGGAYRVVVQNDLSARRTVDDALSIRFPGKDGAMVPLSAVGCFDYILGPRVIPRFNGLPSAGIVISPAEGVTSLEVVDLIEKDPPDPSKYVLYWSSMTEQERESRGKLKLLVALALAFIYLVLVARYESWRLPIPVLLGSAFAVAGAATGLWLAGESLSIYAQLGLLLMIEFPMRSAMTIVDEARALENGGMDVREAAREGASRSFRAVFVSLAGFALSLLVLVFATGVGAAAQRAIAVTVASGTAASLLFGAVAVPVLYVLFHRPPRMRRDGSRDCSVV